MTRQREYRVGVVEVKALPTKGMPGMDQEKEKQIMLTFQRTMECVEYIQKKVEDILSSSNLIEKYFAGELVDHLSELDSAILSIINACRVLRKSGAKQDWDMMYQFMEAFTQEYILFLLNRRGIETASQDDRADDFFKTSLKDMEAFFQTMFGHCWRVPGMPQCNEALKVRMEFALKSGWQIVDVKEDELCNNCNHMRNLFHGMMKQIFILIIDIV